MRSSIVICACIQVFLVGASCLAASAAHTPLCRESQLSTHSEGPEMVMGALYSRIQLRNTSNRTCELHGYPEVKLFDRQGTSVPVRIENTLHFNSGSPATLSLLLKPGIEAFFTVMTVSSAYLDPPRHCESELRLYLHGTGDARPLLTINSESCESIMVSGFGVGDR